MSLDLNIHNVQYISSIIKYRSSSSPGQCVYIGFSGKTLNTHSASL